ncbi:G-type lectin S-receptor-like serine/threonine-protein kinase At1g61400 isoform X2 [Oryza brachyantha]|uniref:G-type lectin S-receptor-like serine/threonine-protein kinase At1g61400 isoform X2 n=1 Tax=Oryza brachyantha TaxID=4533 RepID=UPI001AD9DA18|nr:G-type lectin S-receptor-like serine/threonine-protein kinase At1g61400 isoform X2 [Oryza brachyantha]
MVRFTMLLLLLSIPLCKTDDQLTPEKPLFPGEMLISKSGVFALGFFSPAANSSKGLYVGIWFHDIPERTVVWVANRDSPVTAPSSAKLAISSSSEMVLSESDSQGGGCTLWTTKSGAAGAGASSAVLLDTGNLVLRSPNGTDVWQSFDHPTDTVLAGMMFLMSYRSRVVGRLVAWRSPDDPSTGDFSFSLDPGSDLQGITWNGTKPYCRNGVRTGVSASGSPYPISSSNTSAFVYQMLVDTGSAIYYTYTVSGGSSRTRITLDHTGAMTFRGWDNASSSWTVISQRPAAAGSCEVYASCGPFGYCDLTGPVPTCRCLDGFEPVDGGGASFSRGCRRKQELRCGETAAGRFVSLPGMKAPDKFLHVRNRTFDQCAAECRRNCSCMAYAYANLSSSGTLSDPSRCLIWTGELVDMGARKDVVGDTLYLRVADSSGPNSTVNSNKKRDLVVKIVLPAVVCLLTFTTFIYIVTKHKPRGIRRKKEMLKIPALRYFSTSHDSWDQNLEFACISFEEVATATNSFHETNMLGQGGFGKVYKGTMVDGKEVAVKRLSKCSEQGTEQFRNEVVLIAKLQHKNLVRLLGCCIHGDEKLLIYEYLPNKSLDKFLFNHGIHTTLDWPRRFKIIEGVARGLLYLHQDSRMRIIHRDLKASNILLDAEMNPKISDFGLARIFAGNEQQESTKRVVGTYGYMSPEYAMQGKFSVKSDTYSFGVLLLEIVSGLKAWNLWKNGRQRDFVDTSILESCSLSEVFKCIHIGLLCVQDSPNARPPMSLVVSMLDNEDIPRPMPKQPVYFAQRHYEAEEPTEDLEKSVNDVSLTMLEGR